MIELIYFLIGYFLSRTGIPDIEVNVVTHYCVSKIVIIQIQSLVDLTVFILVVFQKIFKSRYWLIIAYV